MQISVSEPELGGRSEGDEAKFHSPAEYVFLAHFLNFHRFPKIFPFRILTLGVAVRNRWGTILVCRQINRSGDEKSKLTDFQKWVRAAVENDRGRLRILHM